MKGVLVNKVAQSSLETINLEKYYPVAMVNELDIADYLFKGLILKEKDFRSALKELDWSIYADTTLCVHCSTDAIIPVWAYMLISTYAESYCKTIYQGSPSEFIKFHYYKVLAEIDYDQYQDSRVVIKGCSDKPVPPAAYAYITEKLKPFAQSIMYGEPCSTVPIFKRPRKLKSS